MNYLLQTIGLLLFSSFVISCTSDRLGPEIQNGVKVSNIDGASLEALLSGETKKLKESGHKVEVQWSHKKVDDGTYQVLAEMKVLDAPKLSKIFEWKATKTPSEVSNHWLVRADNKDTKRLVARPE